MLLQRFDFIELFAFGGKRPICKEFVAVKFHPCLHKAQLLSRQLTGKHLATALLHHRNAKGESIGMGDETRVHLGRMIEEVLS